MSDFKTWLVLAEDGDGKIHIFYKTIDESESWTLDALQHEVQERGLTVLAMYREGDIVEYTGL